VRHLGTLLLQQIELKAKGINLRYELYAFVAKLLYLGFELLDFATVLDVQLLPLLRLFVKFFNAFHDFDLLGLELLLFKLHHFVGLFVSLELLSDHQDAFAFLVGNCLGHRSILEGFHVKCFLFFTYHKQVSLGLCLLPFQAHH
jgi:hypothetical protein